MTASEHVEALIENSPVSLLRDQSGDHTDYASYSKTKSLPASEIRKSITAMYEQRPKRIDRFLGDERERGGTVVVHYIKKQEWFVETMVALLGGAEEGERERWRW
jgi:hypothetical protein